MSLENATAIEDEIKALEERLAKVREQKLQREKQLQQQKEALLAELARQEAEEEAVRSGQDDDDFSIPEIRVKEHSDAADPPKLETAGKSMIGALKRKIETVTGQNELQSAASANAAPADFGSAFASLEKKLDAIAKQISSTPHDAHAVTEEALQQVMNEIVTAISRQAQTSEQQAHAIRTDLHTIHSQGVQLAEQLGELTAEPEEDEPPTPAFTAPGGLEAAVCGESLAADPSLAPARHELVSGFLANDCGAKSLVGQLLLFQGAPDDRMPQLLKDVGEAYYRWRPQAAHATDPFQHAMIEWLAAECEQAGSANRIELVRPGDRYDAARHHAKTRGLEITEVYGWVVLRDNGKVYTKAAVAVK